MVAKSAALLGFLSLAAAAPTKVARDTCAKSITINAGDSCWAICNANGISLDQLYSYNSGINKGCTNLIAGNSICVAVKDAKPTTTTKPAETKTPPPTSGDDKCEKTYTVKAGDGCWDLANANGITVEQILALNPSVNQACTNLIIGQTLCLASGTQPPKTTPTSPPTSSDDKCGKTYTVKSGDGCWALANANGITVEQILALNPSVNQACTNLAIGQTLCLASGTQPPKTTPTVPKTTPTGPSYQNGDCSKTVEIKGGDSCSSIASANGITIDQLLKWNNGIDASCTNLYAGDSVCVAK